MIFGARAAGGGFAGAAGGAFIMLAIVAAWFHHWILAAVLIGFVILVRSGASLRRRAPRMMVSAYGVTWMHPVRGNGALVWRDVGAIAIREARGGRELAVYLVPRPPERGGPEPASFILSSEDLGGDRQAAETALREFAGSVLPRLPRDLVADRETRRWLGEWGIAWPPPAWSVG